MNIHNDFLNNAVDDELETEGIGDLTTDVCSNMQNDTEKMCLSLQNGAHRNCGVDTKEMIPAYRRRYAEILEFTHFVQFFIFNSVGKNHKEKEFVL